MRYSRIPRATRPRKQARDNGPSDAGAEEARLPRQRPTLHAISSAITNGAANRKLIVREYWRNFIHRLFDVAPDPPPTDADSLVAVLSKTTTLVAEFARLCETIAAVNDAITASTVYAGFGEILTRYDVTMVQWFEWTAAS